MSDAEEILGIGDWGVNGTDISVGKLAVHTAAGIHPERTIAIGASLLPPVDNLRASSATVALAGANRAAADGVATATPDDMVQAVQDAMWQPAYPQISTCSAGSCAVRGDQGAGASRCV